MKLEELFTALASEAGRCLVCERMRERVAVLGPLNGSLRPRVMFVAEAPGRNGADRTRIPFHGDASGRTFDHLLASIELTRDDIFITNSVLCSPRKPSGANDKPTTEEIRNCSGFLRRTIEVINPPIIATLGTVALNALKLIEPHDFKLRDAAAKTLDWNGRLLVPLYHPSPQVLIATRNLAQQLIDFQGLSEAMGKSSRESRE